MDNDALVERVARVIASELGDDYELAPANKREWTKTHGQFRGAFRDVNQPFKCNYDDAARAAIAEVLSSTPTAWLYDYQDGTPSVSLMSPDEVKPVEHCVVTPLYKR